MAVIFSNGRIYTMDQRRPTPNAVLVDKGIVRWTGDIGGLPTIGSIDKLNRVNLEGRTLIPGFNDAHVHIWKLGLLLTMQVDARRANAPDIPSIIARFHEKAEQTSPGTWLTGRGYNEAELPEGRHPTCADLDAASAQHPIALTRTCGHMIVANSLALELAGISAETPDPPGGVIVRDAAGEPTGLLQETAMGLITRARNAADERTTDIALTAAGAALRERAVQIPAAVVARLGVDLAELEHLHDVLTRINSAAQAAGAL